MELHLRVDLKDDLIEVLDQVSRVRVRDAADMIPGALDELALALHQLLFKAIRKKGSEGRNNPLVWWAAILARSVWEGQKDYISSGRFNMNPLPMDVEIIGRVDAIMHYGKIVVLHEICVLGRAWLADRGPERLKSSGSRMDRRGGWATACPF